MYENNIHLYLSFNSRGSFSGYFSYSIKWRTIFKTSSRQWQVQYWLTISKTVFTVVALWSYLWYTVYNNFSNIKAHLIFSILLWLYAWTSQQWSKAGNNKNEINTEKYVSVSYQDIKYFLSFVFILCFIKVRQKLHLALHYRTFETSD